MQSQSIIRWALVGIVTSACFTLETAFGGDASKKTGQLTGVVRWVDGRPLVNPQVKLHRFDNTMYRWKAAEQQADVNADGKFVFNDVSTEEYWCVSIRVPGAGVTFRQTTVEQRVADIIVRDMPTIRGTVFGPDGKPAAKTLVRAFSDSILRFTAKPVLTDATGNFEIPLTTMPVHPKTETRMYEHQVYAFSPYEPVGGVATIDLRNEESVGHVAIRMTEQPVAWPLSEMRSAFTPWERGEPDERMSQERLKPENTVGSPVPELDGNLWLNTDFRSLADFRGQFVFLDFYTTWCGPCRADFPTVKLVYDLYRDHGVTVIGVHDNSSAHDAIREHAAEHHMEMPIIVDHEDGRTLKAYEQLWLANGYPSYVLVDPNGRLVKSDRCTPSPSLRSYKLEVVRQALLQHKLASK